MNWNALIRQFHRWVSIAFTLGFLANLFAITLKPYPAWVGLFALIPLLLLLVSGLYMFVLPYAAAALRRRGAGGDRAPA